MTRLEATTLVADPAAQAASDAAITEQQKQRSRAVAASPSAKAVDDLVDGFSRWRLWSLIAWMDIRQRYRRSLLGPFWITVSMLVMVGTLGIIYSTLFSLHTSEFLPYLAGGFVVWFFVSAVLSEACGTFISAEGMIKQGGLPLSTHVYRLICRNVIILGHNMVVIPIMLAIFEVPPTWANLLVVPGLLLVLVNLTWMVLLLGPMCTRFRDVPYVVNSLLQIVFYVTPILFKPELLHGRFQLLIALNPFHHLVELIRGPILGQVPPLETWAFATGLACVGWVVAFLFYRRTRGRIAYWL